MSESVSTVDSVLRSSPATEPSPSFTDQLSHRVFNLNRSQTVEAIISNWASTPDQPAMVEDRVLAAVLDYAMSLGAQSAVLETEYIDADYRDEHASFWHSTFRQYPTVAARLHFFSDPPSAFQPPEPKPYLFSHGVYLGYTVLRPLTTAPVGRTMLPWNPDLARSRDQVVVCAATDEINLFGSSKTVDAVPFYSQDRRLTRCGHVTMMSTAYHHHLGLHSERVLPGQIADAAGRTLNERGRAKPSSGVNLAQLVEAASSFGAPPLVYPLRRRGDDPEATICRYLNSGLPVTVKTRKHAFLLVGYERIPDSDDTHSIRFLRHDDIRGPYQWSELRLDRYGDWEYVIVPLPTKVHLSGGQAEEIGRNALLSLLEQSPKPLDQELRARYDDERRPLSWRSKVMRSNYFKSSIHLRGLPDPVAAAYQFVHMSRFVWVVELTDRSKRDQGQPCVVAEVVVDATDHPEHPRPLAYRTPAGFVARDPQDDLVMTDYRLTSPAFVESVMTV